LVFTLTSKDAPENRIGAPENRMFTLASKDAPKKSLSHKICRP